jgi:hypothetical protein
MLQQLTLPVFYRTSYSCKLLNITARNATSFLPASCYDFTVSKCITVIFITNDVSTFIFSVKKKDQADNHFHLATPSKSSKWLPYLTCERRGNWKSLEVLHTCVGTTHGSVPHAHDLFAWILTNTMALNSSQVYLYSLATMHVYLLSALSPSMFNLSRIIHI